MFQFVYLSVLRICINLKHIVEAREAEDALVVVFDDKRENRYLKGEDASALRKALQMPLPDSKTEPRPREEPSEQTGDGVSGANSETPDEEPAAETATQKKTRKRTTKKKPV